MTLYSLNPDTFHAADDQMRKDAEWEEWPKLHGDGMPKKGSRPQGPNRDPLVPVLPGDELTMVPVRLDDLMQCLCYLGTYANTAWWKRMKALADKIV